MEIYTKSIVPEICQDRDDSNYGSSATRDIECLQALSRRIHYGKNLTYLFCTYRINFFIHKYDLEKGIHGKNGVLFIC